MMQSNFKNQFLYFACKMTVFCVASSFTLSALPVILPAQAAHPTAPASSRSVDQTWGTKRAVTEEDKSKIAKYRKGQYKSSLWDHFKDAGRYKAEWLPQTDDADNLLSCRRPQNISISEDGLTLKTLKASDCHARWSTASMWSRFRQKYGFYEARIQIADITGINNAFWLTTEDGYEIDIAEVHYPSSVNTTLHKWKPAPHHAVGYHNVFSDDFSQAFHDYSVLWTPRELIFAVDGEPISAITTNDSIGGTADIRFSTAVAPFAGKIPEHPENHNMKVKYLHVYPLQE